MKQRTAKIERNTTETQISLELNLDGTGKYIIDTPIGFLNHLLELFAKHGTFDLTLKATGDIEHDDHHVIEDIGIVLGQAIQQAVGDKLGIKRYGFFILPMDEVLCLTAVDLAGRYAFVHDYKPVREKVNDFPTEMWWHMMQQVALEAKMNLHVQMLSPGDNEHHRLEGITKSFAHALREAVSIDERNKNVLPSTKGKL